MIRSEFLNFLLQKRDGSITSPPWILGIELRQKRCAALSPFWGRGKNRDGWENDMDDGTDEGGAPGASSLPEQDGLMGIVYGDKDEV